MRAAQCARIFAIAQLCDGAPADRAKPCGNVAIMPQRQVKRIRRRSARPRPRNFVDIEREAGCGLVAATNRIGTAPPDHAAHALSVEGEANPALVFEPVPLSRIERNARAIANS